jgi:hypothetical protein
MVTMAIDQLLCARDLCKQRNALLGKAGSFRKDADTNGATPVAGSRSGNAVKSSDSPQAAEIDVAKQKWSLKTGYFAVMGGFKVRMEDIIEDKTKADYLAKGLICVQVGWMWCKQLPGKPQGYPSRCWS